MNAPQNPLLRVVRAAQRWRSLDRSRATGATVYAWNEFCEALDALAEIGAVAALADLPTPSNTNPMESK